jgi:general stress protein YciG
MSRETAEDGVNRQSLGTCEAARMFMNQRNIDASRTRKVIAMAETHSTTGKSNRGFASMDRAKQREIARKGGESVPNEKRSFSQNRELAAAAGRKGGEASQGARRKPN